MTVATVVLRHLSLNSPGCHRWKSLLLVLLPMASWVGEYRSEEMYVYVGGWVVSHACVCGLVYLFCTITAPSENESPSGSDPSREKWAVICKISTRTPPRESLTTPQEGWCISVEDGFVNTQLTASIHHLLPRACFLKRLPITPNVLL